MRNGQNQKILFYVLIGFGAIGIVTTLMRDVAGAIIPIVVLGGVFLLYKFPPSRWKSMTHRARAWSDSNGAARHKSKRAKFRVIPGNKRDDDDNNNIPKYH
ncbi:hypothetical protein MO973_07950 [Paenibacillus sp. TRM 82003]|nr:hypothetical protein [Paenibacillus sp. TRM 82003]